MPSRSPAANAASIRPRTSSRCTSGRSRTADRDCARPPRARPGRGPIEATLEVTHDPLDPGSAALSTAIRGPTAFTRQTWPRGRDATIPAVWKRVSQPSSARLIERAVEHVGVDALDRPTVQRGEPARVAHSHPHLVATVGERSRHVRAHEAGRACHADLHRPFRSGTSPVVAISMAPYYHLTDTSTFGRVFQE